MRIRSGSCSRNDRRSPGIGRGTAAESRHGLAAVEAAILLPVLLTLLTGVWEIGRLIEVQQILTAATREGARLAAGGTSNGTDVTVAAVQQAVRDYMTASGLPAAAVSGAQIQVVNLSANSWTDPVNAKPLDSFKISVVIPPGAAFQSLSWSSLASITGVRQLSASVMWSSCNNSQVVVDTQLPQ